MACLFFSSTSDGRIIRSFGVTPVESTQTAAGFPVAASRIRSTWPQAVAKLFFAVVVNALLEVGEYILLLQPLTAMMKGKPNFSI